MDKEIPFEVGSNTASINMNDIVGECDILFICLDTLRYDVAKKAEVEQTIPILNKYGEFQQCTAPANFTYPSHHAMFIGFLPAPVSSKNISERELLFFPKKIGMGHKAPASAFAFEGPTFIEGLSRVGYHTMCIGGVAFFDKRSDIGKVLPSMFLESHWNPKFSCIHPKSAENQVEFTIKKIKKLAKDKKVFCYINFSAIHYPNYFYKDGEKQDNIATHQKALEYIDTNLKSLFKAFKKRNKTFVIVTSDHGTCYGEDGYSFHGINHSVVNTVPYKHFFL